MASLLNRLSLSILLLLVLVFGWGCASTEPRMSQALPPRVMTELMAHATSPQGLGYRREAVMGRQLWRPPATGYHLAGGSVTVPMALEAGLPVIAARINSRVDLPLIVDTGAPSTLLAGRPCAAAAVRTVLTNQFPAQAIRGLTGSERSCVTVLDQLQIGPMVITNLAAWVSLEEPARGKGPLGASPVSLLGLLPVLAGSSYVTFDYPGRSLTIAPRDEFQPPSEASLAMKLPLVISNETLRVSVGFPNGYRTDFVVDTGAAADFVVTTSTIQNGGLNESVSRGRPRTMQGVGGELMEINFSIEAIELAGRRFATTRAITGSWSTHDLLGTGWLSQFRATFDFRRQILWLERPGQ